MEWGRFPPRTQGCCIREPGQGPQGQMLTLFQGENHSYLLFNFSNDLLWHHNGERIRTEPLIEI